MRVLLLAILACGPVAGCLAPVDPGSVADAGLPSSQRLACFEHDMLPVCNIETTTTNEEGNEVTIAVNPKNPMNIVAGAKDYTEKHTGGQCVWDGVYVTKDGGKSWLNYNIPGSPWVLLAEPSEFAPTPASAYWCATDPVVAFDAEGTLYYSFMAYQGDPVTASKLGAGVLPQGGLNDWLFNRVAMMVAVSKDGGETIEGIYEIAKGSDPVNFHDKQWIEVDPLSGNVYVGWVSFGGPPSPVPAATVTTWFYRSTDGGRTWSGLVLGDSVYGPSGEILSQTGVPGGSDVMIATGPASEVLVSWSNSGRVYLATSEDEGVSFGEPWIAFEFEDDGMEATYRSGGQPWLAMDRSTGPYAGSVYFAWQDTRHGDRDVLFSASRDGGKTWSDPTVLNDDGPGAGADQFFPAMSVAPNGRIDVVWYDRRWDPAGKLLDLVSTSSADGGATWTSDLRVTEVSSDPDKSHHQNGMIFIGDYIDIDSSAEAAHPVWVDTRNGVADVFTAIVLARPDGVWAFEGPELGEHGH